MMMMLTVVIFSGNHGLRCFFLNTLYIRVMGLVNQYDSLMTRACYCVHERFGNEISGFRVMSVGALPLP